MKLIGEKTLDIKDAAKIVEKINAKEMTKGAGIRELFAGGFSVREISTMSGIRYNHVYNVVKNEVLVRGLDVEKSGRGEDSKKAQIVQMLEAGKSITEVSRELKCLYNYVWQVAKASGLTGKKTEEVVQEETKEVKANKKVVGA